MPPDNLTARKHTLLSRKATSVSNCVADSFCAPYIFPSRCASAGEKRGRRGGIYTTANTIIRAFRYVKAADTDFHGIFILARACGDGSCVIESRFCYIYYAHMEMEYRVCYTVVSNFPWDLMTSIVMVMMSFIRYIFEIIISMTYSRSSVIYIVCSTGGREAVYTRLSVGESWRLFDPRIRSRRKLTRNLSQGRHEKPATLNQPRLIVARYNRDGISLYDR